MSAKRTTVGDLKRILERYPDDMLVTSISPSKEEWEVEGTLDGIRVYDAHVHEVRTGWQVVHPSDVGSEPKLLVIAADGYDHTNLLEWQDQVFNL